MMANNAAAIPKVVGVQFPRTSQPLHACRFMQMPSLFCTMVVLFVFVCPVCAMLHVCNGPLLMMLMMET